MDTAFVLIALRQVAYPDEARIDRAIDAGLAWLLGMQNDDGGWGAFQIATNDCATLTQVSVRRSQRDDRSLDRGCHGACARVPRSMWLPRIPSGGRPRPGIPASGSNARRRLVWPLGRELHLRNQRRPARTRSARRRPWTTRRACRGLVAHRAEPRRRVRRNLRLVRGRVGRRDTAEAPLRKRPGA